MPANKSLKARVFSVFYFRSYGYAKKKALCPDPAAGSGHPASKHLFSAINIILKPLHSDNPYSRMIYAIVF